MRADTWPALNHHVDVRVGQGSAIRQLPMPQRWEGWRGRLGSQIVVAGELGDLATLFHVAHPAAALLNMKILDFHVDGGSDTSERVAHSAR